MVIDAPTGSQPVYSATTPPPPGAPWPASIVAKRHMSDFIAMPGIATFTYSPAWPNEIRIKADTLAHAQLAQLAFKDSVDGVSLVYVDPAGGPYDMTAPYPGSVMDAVKAVAGLPGIVRYLNPAQQTLILHADTRADADRLRGLVRPMIGSLRVNWGVLPPRTYPS